MSASPVFTAAALSRPFIFSPASSPHHVLDDVGKKKAASTMAGILAAVGASPKLTAVVPAARLDVRAAPEMVSSGIPQLDALTGGFPRGCLTEICGSASSGRTSVLLLALARATRRGEVCALVDASDAFDPASAAAAGMEMSRLLWVRCGDSPRFRKSAALEPVGQRIPQRQKFSPWKNPERQRWETQLAQMLKVTDLLLQSNGFGMIALDLGDVPARSARQIPLASWFRFRRAVEHTPTSLLVLEQQPIAGSCSSVLLRVGAQKKLPVLTSSPSANRASPIEMPHARLLDQFEITAELLRSRLERKPVQSVTSFKSRASWAG